MESCGTSGIAVSDHFREVTKMITAGKGEKRSVKDCIYACCLIAQNGNLQICERLFHSLNKKQAQTQKKHLQFLGVCDKIILIE
jgi:DNA-damage-inducible protein D